MDDNPEKMSPVGLGYESINRLERSLRQFQMIDKHYDWKLWLGLSDLSGNNCSIHQTQMVLDHNCIDGPRHQKP